VKTDNAHNNFFVEVFSNRENALDFLLGTLPPRLKNELNLNTIKLDSGSYVDEELKTHFSDILYTCKTISRKDVYVSLLFEHKSYKPRYPRLQLLRYMLNIWYSQVKQRKPLQPVIPIVLYHGRGKWRKKRFAEYFPGMPAVFKRFIPRFDYLLTDLSDFSDEDIKSSTYSRSALIISLLIMKYIFKPKMLLSYLKKFLELDTLYYREEEGLKFIESVFRYIFLATEIEQERIVEKAAAISDTVEEKAMTTGEKLINKGLKQGIEQGREEGIEQGIEQGREEGIEQGIEQGELIEKQNVLFRLLSRKFSLNDAEKEKIRSCRNPEKLDAALDTILTAEEKSEVLGLLV